jgi:hypothetical protein
MDDSPAQPRASFVTLYAHFLTLITNDRPVILRGAEDDEWIRT